MGEDLTLLQRFVLASAGHVAEVAVRAGGRAERWADLAAADAGSPVFFDNMAVLLAPPADLDDVLDRLEGFYPPARHLSLLSAWPLPAPLRDGRPLYGWELTGHPPLMLRPPGGAAPPPPPGLEVVEVAGARALGQFVDTLLAAFGMSPAPGLPLADPRVLDGPFRFFLGLVDGAPVATAGARLGHGLVDVEWVATIPAARGRGYGAAVSWAATLADPGLPAVLIASDDGRPVYERMGYLPLLRTTMWHRPPAG